MGDATPALADDFRDFLAELAAHRVDAVLVGGYALGVHGVIRATGDIDFLYRRTKANVARLCAALAAFGAPASVIDATVLLAPETVTWFGEPPHRIDLLSDISGVTFAEVWRGSAVVDLDGIPVRVIGLAELRRNKAATGRAKDAADLQALGTSRPRRPTR